MGLIRVLIIFIAVLYIIRVIARALLPMLFNNLVNKAQQHQQNQYTNYQQTDPRESKVKVDFIPPTTSKGKVPDSEGDFIDYEEIK